MPQIVLRPLHHQHVNQITRHCEPSSSLVLPLQPQLFPYPTVRTTTLKICVIFDLMDQLRERVHQEITVYGFHDPPGSPLLYISIDIYAKPESAVTKSPLLDIVLNNLPKILRTFSRRKLTSTVRTSH